MLWGVRRESGWRVTVKYTVAHEPLKMEEGAVTLVMVGQTVRGERGGGE